MAKCDTCALVNENKICPVFKADMSGQDGCPLFTTELHNCDICGRTIYEKAILQEDQNGDWHELCHNCLNASPCQTCIHQYCAFQQDQNCQEQPYIMVQQRQGNMIMQTQTLNPKRVEATCRQGCPCFNEEGLDDGTFCKRQSMCGCEKHRINWRN